MKPFFLFLLFFFSISVGLKAQNSTVDPEYLAEAGVNAILFRGEEAMRYPLRYTGTWFAFGPDYEVGEVVYDNMLYTNVKLNLNSHLDELYVLHPNNVSGIRLSKSKVKSFKMGDKCFIKLNDQFVRVLYEGEFTILQSIRKKYIESISEKLKEKEKIFDPDIHYFVSKDGVLYNADTQSKFCKATGNPEMKKIIRQFSHKKDIYFGDDKEQFYVALMKWLNRPIKTR